MKMRRGLPLRITSRRALLASADAAQISSPIAVAHRPTTLEAADRVAEVGKGYLTSKTLGNAIFSHPVEVLACQGLSNQKVEMAHRLEP